MIKLGQIGIGHNHGAKKLEAARKFPSLFEIVGYAEPDEGWIGSRGKLSAYEGIHRMELEELIEKCDALLIESDIWNLDKYAKMCLEAGKHIHMDKPSGASPEVFGEILSLAESKGLIVQMGYMYRYNNAIMKTFEKVKNGELGEIFSINAEMSTFHSPYYKEWLKNFNGGIMYILGSHLVDLIVYLLGEPKKTTSFLKSTGLDGIEFEDNNLAVLEYDKAIARIFVSSVEVNGWGRRQFMVSGSLGTIDIKPIENNCHMTYSDLEIAKNPYEDMKQIENVSDIPKDCRYDMMMQDFYSYIIGEKENPFTYEHEYKVQKVLSDIVGGIGYRNKKPMY